MKKMILALLFTLYLPLAVGHAQIAPPINPDPQNTSSENDRILSATAGQAAVSAVAGQVADRMGFYPTSSVCATGTCDDHYRARAWSSVGYNYYYKTGPEALVGGQTLGLAGLDKWASDNLLLGLAVGGEYLNLNGSGEARRKAAGLTVLPYLGYRFTEGLALDASLGYTWLVGEPTPPPLDVDAVLGYLQNPSSFEDAFRGSLTRRFFTAAGLTQSGLFGPLALSGRLGGLYLHQSKTFDQAMRQSPGGWDLFQASLSGRAVYLAGDFKPFIGFAYLQDIGRSGGDTAGADFNLGFSWALNACSELVLESVYGLRESLDKYGGRLAFQFNF